MNENMMMIHGMWCEIGFGTIINNTLSLKDIIA
jgi:hypothetical protein